jgi:transmembrane sensor
VSLDAGSTLRVGFTDARRDVHLLDGKAMFDVAMDPARPFVVNTFLVDVAADKESKFAVRIDTSVEVSVYDGIVSVSGRGAKAGAPVISLKSGESYRVPMNLFREIVASGKAAQRAPKDG